MVREPGDKYGGDTGTNTDCVGNGTALHPSCTTARSHATKPLSQPTGQHLQIYAPPRPYSTPLPPLCALPHPITTTPASPTQIPQASTINVATLHGHTTSKQSAIDLVKLVWVQEVWRPFLLADAGPTVLFAIRGHCGSLL